MSTVNPNTFLSTNITIKFMNVCQAELAHVLACQVA